VNTILYADDQILMATSEDDLQTVAHHLNLIARKYKMTISSKDKGKAVPLQAWSGPGGSRKLKVPRFHYNGTGWW